MTFAKIENERCVNILEFDTEENAYNFDENLVLVEDGFGIGDVYKDGAWHKYQKTKEEIDAERIEEIKTELKVLDGTVDRQWEDYYIRENVTPVDRIAVVITQKEELREELQKITGGDSSEI